MTIGLLAALALQSLPAPTLPDWQRVGGDASGEYAVYAPGIRRSGSEVTALVRIDVTRGERTGARVGGVIRYVYNCQAGTFRMEVGDLYNAQGEFIGAAPFRPEHLTDRPVPADTPSASVRDYLCQRQAQ